MLEKIEKRIYLVRGLRVMLDSDLADLYGVPTGRLNEQVQRNKSRFPSDFMFSLSPEELENLRSQIATSKHAINEGSNLISQIAISSLGHGGRRKPSQVFTEQGVAMLSSVLHSDRAVQVNIAIMRAFVRLREMLASHKELARKLEALESRYDAQFKIVFDAIRELMREESKNKRAIGF